MRGFKKRLQEADDAKEKGDIEEMQVKQDQTLRIYLLYLVWVTLFTNKSANYVEVTYLKYFRYLEFVSDYSWEAFLICLDV